MKTTSDPAQLSPQQRELLVAATASRGRCDVRVSARARGRAVCAGKRVFCIPGEPTVARGYLAALEGLVKQRLLRPEGAREKYELTSTGWILSRKLASRAGEGAEAGPDRGKSR